MNERALTWRLEPEGTRLRLECERDKRRFFVGLELRAPRERQEREGRESASDSPGSPLRDRNERTARDVELTPGMTPEQVEDRLGAPVRVVRLGSKTIWSYEGFTVTFVDGVVQELGER